MADLSSMRRTSRLFLIFPGISLRLSIASEQTFVARSLPCLKSSRTPVSLTDLRDARVAETYLAGSEEVKRVRRDGRRTGRLPIRM